MDQNVSYGSWDSRCKSLLELHPCLGALCVCDQSNLVLGSAFTNPEFEGITRLNEYTVKPLLLISGSAMSGKTSVTFLNDRFLVVDTLKRCFEAKSGNKSLFLRQTSALYLIGLSVEENDGTEQHLSARRAMNSIQEYFEAADF